MTAEDCMTITDSHGASIVFERDPRDGVVGVWIAPQGENDGYSVLLGQASKERIAAFLLDGAR